MAQSTLEMFLNDLGEVSKKYGYIFGECRFREREPKDKNDDLVIDFDSLRYYLSTKNDEFVIISKVKYKNKDKTW